MPDQNAPLGSVATEKACDKKVESGIDRGVSVFVEGVKSTDLLKSI